MDVSVSFKVQPFMVPATVSLAVPPGSRSEGFKRTPEIPLVELSVVDLEALCAQFTHDVLTAKSDYDLACIQRDQARRRREIIEDDPT